MAVISIPLTKGMFALIDECDTELVSGYKWIAHNRRGKYYATAAVPGLKPRVWVDMHRLILGIIDKSVKSDHRDGNSLNNIRSNLRPASSLQNSRNAPKTKSATSSRYKGVCKRRSKWESRITVNKEIVHLGMHVSEEEAARAYDAAAIKYFGEFAAVNFPAAGQMSAHR